MVVEPLCEAPVVMLDMDGPPTDGDVMCDVVVLADLPAVDWVEETETLVETLLARVNRLVDSLTAKLRVVVTEL